MNSIIDVPKITQIVVNGVAMTDIAGVIALAKYYGSGGGGADDQVRNVGVIDYNDEQGIISRNIQWFIDNKKQNLVSRQYVDYITRSENWLHGGEYSFREVCITGPFKGKNLLGFRIYTSNPQYQGLFYMGATDVNLGFNLYGGFLDINSPDQDIISVPLKYRDVEIANQNHFAPNYDSEKEEIIEGGQTFTATSNMFILWSDDTDSVSINNSSDLPAGLYPVCTGDVIKNNQPEASLTLTTFLQRGVSVQYKNKIEKIDLGSITEKTKKLLKNTK